MSLTGGWNVAFGSVDQKPSTPSKADLDKHRVPELSNDYIIRIEEDWYKCVYAYVPVNTPSVDKNNTCYAVISYSSQFKIPFNI